MYTHASGSIRSHTTGLVNILSLGGFLLALSVSSVAQNAKPANVAEASQARVFKTGEDAVAALLAAFQKEDEQALLDIFGREHEKLIVVTDKVARQQAFRQIARAFGEAKRLEAEGENRQILVIGNEAWPFPIPLVKEAAGWRFDTAAGVEEILNRRIGEGELEAIAVCRAYPTAQVEYARVDRDGDEVLEYAQRLLSTPGQRDGLYWEPAPAATDAPSPFGPLLAEAGAYLEAGKQAKTPIPYKGYYYKVLTKQGKNPPGGQYDYIINGNMIAGFALLAVPADYGSSGIMTFVISHQGKLYQKDLGEKTLDIAKQMTEYDPDPTWELVKGD